MLNEIVNRTNNYIKNMPKVQRKKYGQFFTSKETAEFMANLLTIPKDKEKIRFLDPGAGTGILSCALIERLESIESIRYIEVVCYETDEAVLKLLKDNLKYCKKMSKKTIEFSIFNKNYIVKQNTDFNNKIDVPKDLKYDLIIGNPPYIKISKNSEEALSMSEICYGTPNLYFLFAAMSLFNLKDGCEMVYIIPRSWTSGVYFKKFRKYFLSEGKLKHIHLFISRNKIFEKEDVLQETIIIKIKKEKKTDEDITVTTSKSNSDFHELTKIKIPYNLIVAGEELYVYLITNKEELNVFHKLKYTLPEIGLKMKTGLTVDFRNKDFLRNKPEKDSVPLFYSEHIKQGEISFPIQKENEYILNSKKGLIQKNKNYLFVKRFTSKEEKRRLQCGIYLSKDYPEYTEISTQNKINFIDSLNQEMSEATVYGLYVLFNSTLYDKYYRILNGSTQVNSTEINSMPIPNLKNIENLGNQLLKSRNLSEKNCNLILKEII
ncbi:Eco57I restriction-modification methylase domain-containing protein [Leptotrichia trevisanii]|uniref:Eco57I restriction-modification methylase domain-containing protein n=1 Tax=Leptotrichia trevisanii TaxID=109328 RepID=UPI0026F1E872|nr:Eco57I restriction-modification methylase domain-containing protein [Leptotrichia trevisanii]